MTKILSPTENLEACKTNLEMDEEFDILILVEAEEDEILPFPPKQQCQLRGSPILKSHT